MSPQPACPICTSTMREHLWPAASSPGATPIVRCTACRFIYRLSHPAPGNGPVEWPPAMRIPEEEWGARLTALERAVGRGALLNIGAGAGPFLRMAHNAGWRVADVEPEPPEDEMPPNINMASTLREGLWPAGQFDAVTLWHGLETVPHPEEMLAVAAHYCRIDGVLAVQSLDGDRLAKRHTARTVDGACLPPRLYSPAALRRYLDRFGFRTECVLRFAGTRPAPTLSVIARYVP